MYYHPKFYMDSLKRNILNDNINMMINIKGLIIVFVDTLMSIVSIKYNDIFIDIFVQMNFRSWLFIIRLLH